MTTSPVLIPLALVAFLLAALCSPPREHCAPGFHVEGLHPSGFYQCARPFGCIDQRTKHGGYTSECEGELRYGCRLYCTGGLDPITDDCGCAVGCQRGARQ